MEEGRWKWPRSEMSVRPVRDGAALSIEIAEKGLCLKERLAQ